MNLFGFNIPLNRNSKTEIQKSGEAPLSQAAIAWLRGEESDLAGPLLTSAYEQVVWVYRAINVFAEQVANTPFLFSAGESLQSKTML